MSRATVRAAVASYLTNYGVESLTTVFQHPPKYTAEGDVLPQDIPGIAKGAVVYVHLQEQNERRIAAGGPSSGTKLRHYLTTLICIFRSTLPDTQDVGAANDAFLDSLVGAIQADRNAGNQQVVWQWGEGDAFGAPDIHISAGMPRPVRQQLSQVHSLVNVTVVEQVNT